MEGIARRHTGAGIVHILKFSGLLPADAPFEQASKEEQALAIQISLARSMKR